MNRALLFVVCEIIICLSEVRQMNKGYKFRIYPSAEQRAMFAKTFGCVRFVYNRMLSDKLEKKKSLTPAQYKSEFDWLREVDSLALCNAQINRRFGEDKTSSTN